MIIKTNKMKQIKLIGSIILAIMLLNNMVNAQNQADSTMSGKKSRAFQFTFIPPLGTAGISAQEYSNKFSLNILGGYNGGVEYFELGGIANINKGDVFGGQVAGITNINTGNTQGIQIAGLYNQVTKNMDGMQIAGFMNLNTSKTTGLSASGFTNVIRGDMNGWLMTGFSNVVSGDLNGAQIAGFANVSKGDIKGVQLAGFVNVAKKVNGLQLAFINVADSVSGVPIGFISVVKNGYHKFEVSASESLYGNVTAKTGVKHLYNIFTAGLKPTGEIFYWSVGYGLGSEFNLSPKMNLNIDVTGSHINENQWTRELNIMGTFKINVSYKITEGFELFAGPSYNVFATDITNGENISNDFVPWHFYNETYDDVNVKMYLGFNAGLRF
ncbi:MAG: hypothetical protein DRJ07_11040 [Bacteroidetes bacterium]|nr:MAG: hypothetical protein DRJ07_11040 [Bacteroidota bacterium]